MAEEIKDLIAKIQKEGIEAAEENASKIKVEAENLAQKIIGEAKTEAKRIIEQANFDAKTLNDSTHASLKQASRDLIISLKEEINSVLNRLVKIQVQEALTISELAKIIESLIKNAPISLGSEIIISLNAADAEKLKKGFLKQLAEATKKQITLKSADEIDSGFIISFDAGKSIFDFSGQALMQYIGSCLRPELNKILNSK